VAALDVVTPAPGAPKRPRAPTAPQAALRCAPPARPAAWTEATWHAATLATWNAILRAAKTGDPALAFARAKALGTYPEVVIRRLKGKRAHTAAYSGVAQQDWDGTPLRVRFSMGDAVPPEARWMMIAHELGHLISPPRAKHGPVWRAAYRAIVKHLWNLDVPDLGDRAYAHVGQRNGLDGRMMTAIEAKLPQIEAWFASERKVMP
jgi:hypothetical protein